jgi:hypothetical protein
MDIENNNAPEKDSPTIKDYIEIIVIGIIFFKCIFHILVH